MGASNDLREAATHLRAGAPLSMEVARDLAAWLDQCAYRIDKGHHTGSRWSHIVAKTVLREVADDE